MSDAEGGGIGRPGAGQLFLEPESYRQRRLMDAARLVPFLAGILWLVPMLWTASQGTAAALIYLFVTWLGVIIATAWLARRLHAPAPRRPDNGENRTG